MSTQEEQRTPKPKKRKSEKAAHKAKKHKHVKLGLTPSPEPASPHTAAAAAVTPPARVASPELAAPRSDSRLLPHSPAWFQAATEGADEVQRTACRQSKLGDGVDLVLVHFPDSIDPDTLHEQTVELPELQGGSAVVANAKLEVVREVTGASDSIMVLGAHAGAVDVLDVAASFRVQRCLDPVGSDEDAVDDSLLDAALAAEAAVAGPTDKPPGRKKDKKRKSSASAELTEGQAKHKVASGHGERSLKDKKKRKRKKE